MKSCWQCAFITFAFLIGTQGCVRGSTVKGDESSRLLNVESDCGIKGSYNQKQAWACLEEIFNSRDSLALKQFLESEHGHKGLCEFPNVASELASAFPFREVIEDPLKNCRFSKEELTDALAMSIMLKDNFDADLLVGIDFLCEMGADPNRIHPKYGTSPTMQVNSLETLLLLERYGARADDIARDGQSLLHSAVSSDSVELVGYLLETQPQLRRLKFRGETPLAAVERMINSKPTPERLKILMMLNKYE